MSFNNQKEPVTPHKKRPDHPKKNSKIIIIKGEPTEPLIQIGSGSYFNAFIGIKHTKDCKITSTSKILEENLIEISCFKISNKIVPCPSCVSTYCYDCLKSVYCYSSSNCQAFCILKSKREINEEFYAIITLTNCSENHLLKVYSAEFENEVLTIQTKFLPLTLEALMKQSIITQRSLSLDFVNRIILEISLAIKELNILNLVHNDIKPSNIIYDNKFILTDFNVSQPPGSLKTDGNKKYMAPENLKDRCNFKSDIYSLGLIYFELIGNEIPIDGNNYVFLRESNNEGYFQGPPFIKRMIDNRSEIRPSVEEVIEYFKKLV